MSPLAWVAFLAAAGVGAPARYLLDAWVQERAGGAYPWGTFAVNVSGCLALGVITGLGLHHGLGSTARAVLGAGGLGAYTTFSTLSLQVIRLAQDGAPGTAARYAGASVAAGLAAAGAGLALAALAA